MAFKTSKAVHAQISSLIKGEWKKLTGEDMPEIGDPMEFMFKGEVKHGIVEWYSCTFSEDGCHMDITVMEDPKHYYHVWVEDLVK